MLIGYVRVSTNDQNTELQRNALECAGCELIFEDKISGTKSARPGLKKLLRTLSEGDTLVVWKLDRLGRSVRHLVVLVEELREQGVNFSSYVITGGDFSLMQIFSLTIGEVAIFFCFLKTIFNYITATMFTKAIKTNYSIFMRSYIRQFC